MDKAMTDFNFDEWFELFWKTYPSDLLHNTKGPKEGPWRDKFKSRVKTPEKAEEIISSLREQMRFRRKQKESGEHKSKWCMPMVSVWCNQCRWSEEIPSYTEIKEIPKRKLYKPEPVKKASDETRQQALERMKGLLR
jgi:hypothetical protein